MRLPGSCSPARRAAPRGVVAPKTRTLLSRSRNDAQSFSPESVRDNGFTGTVTVAAVQPALLVPPVIVRPAELTIT